MQSCVDPDQTDMWRFCVRRTLYLDAGFNEPGTYFSDYIIFVAKSSRISFYRRMVGERGGSVVECRTPEREVGGSIPTAAVLCP